MGHFRFYETFHMGLCGGLWTRTALAGAWESLRALNSMSPGLASMPVIKLAVAASWKGGGLRLLRFSDWMTNFSCP